MRHLDKARSAIANVWPQYFRNFDSAPATQNATKQKDRFPLLQLFVAFVSDQNFQAARNPERMALSLATRITLHQTEAKVIHQLKAHIELLEAYRWHQISARRQDSILTNLRNGDLAEDALLIQVDFKENVRYPLSPLVF